MGFDGGRRGAASLPPGGSSQGPLRIWREPVGGPMYRDADRDDFQRGGAQAKRRREIPNSNNQAPKKSQAPITNHERLARLNAKGVDGFQDECFRAIAMNSSADDFTAVVNAI